MINIHKWDKISAKDKLEFIKGIMKITNTNFLIKEDWEIMVDCLLNEVQSCHKELDEYAKMLGEQALIIDDLKKGKKNDYFD